MEKQIKKVLYSAVVLDDKSVHTLIKRFNLLFPNEWKIFCHHMTICLGQLPTHLKEKIGEEVTLEIEKFGISDKAWALKVNGFESANKIPHITLAVNSLGGGKPKDSNDITEWFVPEMGLPTFVSGIVTEITN